MTQPMTGAAPILEARGVVKRFGPLVANDVAYFAVSSGEVVALLGENGAGKSTLCKILYGYYRPDAGEIRVSGRPTSIASPRDARRLGVGMVFQNFSLIPALSVWENVALFLDDLPWAIGPEQMRRRMSGLAERLRLERRFQAPGRPARRRRPAEGRDSQAIARRGARADPRRADQGSGAAGGGGPVPKPCRVCATRVTASSSITHKLREVTACADRVVVMRQGRVVGSAAARRGGRGRALGMMFGAATARPADRRPLERRRQASGSGSDA